MKKKLLTIMLALALAVSVGLFSAACGENGNGTNPNGTDPNGNAPAELCLDELEQKFETAGYEIEKRIFEGGADGGLEWYFSAIKGNIKGNAGEWEMVVIFKFINIQAADIHYEVFLSEFLQGYIGNVETEFMRLERVNETTIAYGSFAAMTLAGL